MRNHVAYNLFTQGLHSKISRQQYESKQFLEPLSCWQWGTSSAMQGLIACNIANVVLLVISTVGIFRIPKAAVDHKNHQKASRQNPRLVHSIAFLSFLQDRVRIIHALTQWQKLWDVTLPHADDVQRLRLAEQHIQFSRFATAQKQIIGHAGIWMLHRLPCWHSVAPCCSCEDALGWQLCMRRRSIYGRMITSSILWTPCASWLFSQSYVGPACLPGKLPLQCKALNTLDHSFASLQFTGSWFLLWRTSLGVCHFLKLTRRCLSVGKTLLSSTGHKG